MRKSILASVIASLFVIIFIQPLLKLMWSFSTGYLFERFTNSIYMNASLGHRNYIDVMFLVMGYGVLCGLLSMSTLNVLRARGHDMRVISETKFFRVFVVILSIVIFVLGLLFVMECFSDLQLNTSFQQRLTVLAPKLSDLEYKELQASWASMKTRSDYLAVNEKMEHLAKVNNIVLPVPLLK